MIFIFLTSLAIVCALLLLLIGSAIYYVDKFWKRAEALDKLVDQTDELTPIAEKLDEELSKLYKAAIVKELYERYNRTALKISDKYKVIVLLKKE